MIVIKKNKIILLIASICFVLSGCANNIPNYVSSGVDIYVSDDVDVFGNKIENKDDIQNISQNTTIKENESSSYFEENTEDSNLQVYFIDVGQADSILIRIDDDENILIDGGNNADGNDLVNYLEYLGVEKIDTIIATHPHEDHIGGLDDVMNNIPCDKIYMPYINEEDIPTTVTYEDFLNAIVDNDLIAYQAHNNDVIYDSGITKLQVISPDTVEPGDLNDYSIVCKLTHGETSFMFTGDASIKIDEDIMDNYSSTFLDVDVLKLGHHGSRTSTNEKWLSITSPTYAVIMCEKGNKYGHPHQEVLQLLDNIKTYRTDDDGTILFTSDGKNIEVKTKLTGDAPLGNKNFKMQN